MSHRLPSSSSSFSRNKLPLPGTHNHHHHHQEGNVNHHKYVHQHYQQGGTTSSSSNNHQTRMYRNSYTHGIATGDTDDTFTDTATYYEYFNDTPQYQTLNHHRGVDRYSEDSGSTRLPLFESEDGNSMTRSNFGYNENRRSQYRESSNSSNTGRDLRRVYPNPEDVGWSRMYHEIPSQNSTPPIPPQIQRLPVYSNRPQSSLSSAIGSTVVDGCGGKCQTCENVCYFFLQLVFTMGILIGISLCIAGTVLRKSAAKNLQVLVYIGVMVSLVSALLLGIQCNSRKRAKKRRKAIWNAKRAPIPMDTLNVRENVRISPQNQQSLMILQENRGQRIVQVPERHNFVISEDEQGIPWWRRKDLRK